MKYYLLKVDDNEDWWVAPLSDKELLPSKTKMIELCNFTDAGDFIQQEVEDCLGGDLSAENQ